MIIRKYIVTTLLSFALFIPGISHAESILTPVSDTVNSGIINTKILGSQSLSHENIDATVINGIAVFSGTVHSKEQVEALTRIARSVTGVKGVDTSKLKVSK